MNDSIASSFTKSLVKSVKSEDYAFVLDRGSSNLSIHSRVSSKRNSSFSLRHSSERAITQSNTLARTSSALEKIEEEEIQVTLVE